MRTNKGRWLGATEYLFSKRPTSLPPLRMGLGLFRYFPAQTVGQGIDPFL